MDKSGCVGENKGVGTAGTAPDHINDAGGIDDMAPPNKSTSPAFQFYPKDFLSSSKVGRMSMTERGVYITLLSHCWLDITLPDDIAQLARLVGIKQARFAKMWAGPLSECFIAKGGRLSNDRLNQERRKQAEFRRRQSDNGRLGGRPKRETQNKAVGFSGLTQNEPKKSSSSSISDLRSASTANAVARAPLHTSHRSHAACGRVCVPAALHGEFVRRRNHDDADTELREWYLVVGREWSDGGPYAAMEPGDSFDFWKARYAEKWPAPNAVKDTRPAWAKGL